MDGHTDHKYINVSFYKGKTILEILVKFNVNEDIFLFSQEGEGALHHIR